MWHTFASQLALLLYLPYVEEKNLLHIFRRPFDAVFFIMLTSAGAYPEATTAAMSCDWSNLNRGTLNFGNPAAVQGSIL